MVRSGLKLSENRSVDMSIPVHLVTTDATLGLGKFITVNRAYRK